MSWDSDVLRTPATAYAQTLGTILSNTMGNSKLIFIALVSITGCIRNDSLPKGIYVDKDEFTKSFKGVENKLVENYPVEIDKYIDEHLNSHYGPEKIDLVKVVTHPATKSKITTDGISVKREPHLDTTVYLAQVKVIYLKNKETTEDNWTYYFNKEAQIEFELKH